MNEHNESPLLKKLREKEKPDTGTAYQSSIETGAHTDRMSRFHARQGQGFAAEQANTLLDRVQGRQAVILGDNNAKNGPDRQVDGILIQTKYCQNAAASVNAAFRNGTYRYVDSQGHPLQLEVPYDQYEEALAQMEKRIIKGQVPGVTDPKQAKDLIRRGNVDYRTACRIAKAGNIDSLLYDAANGTVIAANAMGISAVITYAREIWNGRSSQQAAEMAAYQGLKMGGAVFVSSVLAAQLTRTGVNTLLLGPSINIVKLLPSDIRHAMVQSLRQGPMIYGNAATNNLAKLLRSNIIAAGALTLVLSTGDIHHYFQGKISGKQLFKNVATLAGGMGGGLAGGMAGGALLGPVGAFAGGILAGTIAGEGSRRILDNFIEDDAITMVNILDREIEPLVQEYLLSEEELAIVIDDLQRELSQGRLLDMYASGQPETYGENLLRKIIERIIGFRVSVHLPGETQMIQSMGNMLEMGLQPGALERYLQETKIDPQEIGEKLLGRPVPADAARKAWYVTRQMNAISMQQETALERMQQGDRTAQIQNQKDKEQIAILRQEIDKILGSVADE